jgi:hypothetical protein
MKKILELYLDDEGKYRVRPCADENYGSSIMHIINVMQVISETIKELI